MSQIVRVSMSQQIYHLLKGRIFDQTYDLGEPINILNLSRELGISNTPIREAVQMLCAEGLVTASVNAKFRVMEPTEKSMGELNETIFILLCGAYLSCRHNGETDLLASRLQSAFHEQAEAFAGAQQTYIMTAIDFDRCFVSVCGNEKLLSVFNGLCDQLFLSVRYAYQHNTMEKEENLQEHRDLLEAVKSGEKDRVIELLHHHYNKHLYAQ